MEFSKIIVIAVSILTAIISCFAMIAMLIIQDLSALPVLSTAIFAAFTAGTGFYYNKAKAENLKKLAKELKEEEIDTEDIQTAKILLDNSPIENNNSELY